MKSIIYFWLDYNFWKTMTSEKQQRIHMYYLINTYLTKSAKRNIEKHIDFSISTLPIDTTKLLGYFGTIYDQVNVILLKKFHSFMVDKPHLEILNEQYCLELLSKEMFGEYGLILR